jgi:dipeptidyl aminopeptidase/acylaminoacyl peptidase
MPWIGTELWVARFATGGLIGASVKIAGGPEESVLQPAWSPAGILHFVSDRTGWWNLYRWREGAVEPLAPREAEFGQPQWEFGLSNYAFVSASRIVCSYAVKGIWRLARLDTDRCVLEDLPLPYTDVTHVCGFGGRAVVLAGSPKEPLSVMLVDAENGTADVLRRPFHAPDWEAHYSAPVTVEFPSGDSRTSHAFFFPPHNAGFTGLPGERPPLIVRCHGGPAYAASNALDPFVQYWTSAGFAMLLVNYAGSSNYGRAYRQVLEGRWGRADLEDVVAAVQYAGEQGLADTGRVAVTGRSAGGYLVLRALTRTKCFHAGTSYFGVSDVALLARGTHKFESHYIERLVGAPPEDIEAYRRLSPIHYLENVSSPLVFLQGADDPIAPPEQTVGMMRALRERGVPCMALLFSGESHGFEKSEVVRRSLETEMFLYAMTFLKEPLRA